MKLAILPKQTRGHVVRARLTLRFGTEADFTGVANRVARAALDDDAHARHQEAHLPAAQGRVGQARGAGHLRVVAGPARRQHPDHASDNLPAVLALVDEVLRQPAFPQDQFDIMIKETLTVARRAEARDPQAQAFIAFGRERSRRTRRTTRCTCRPPTSRSRA